MGQQVLKVIQELKVTQEPKEILVLMDQLETQGHKVPSDPQET
jgi:hypothetical protein